MRKRPSRTLAFVVSLMIVASLVTPMVAAQGPVTALSADQAVLARIAPTLRVQAKTGGDRLLLVSVYVQPGTDVGAYMERAAVRTFAGLTVVSGEIKARNLLKLAGLSGVLAVADPTPAPPPRPADEDLTPDIAARAAVLAARREAVKAAGYPAGWTLAKPRDVAATDWFDVLDVHKSKAAWQKGFTGAGVNIVIYDSGVDFAHPDLLGTWAVNPILDSPYYGWPMAFDPRAMFFYALYYGGFGGEVFDLLGLHFGNAHDTITEAAPIWGGTTYVLPGTSKSGTYHIGWFPDGTLAAGAWYGHKVAFLVADEATAGVYDTVYVDLDYNQDFGDEKPTTRDDPVSWKDNWNSEANAPGPDGFPDISGGLIYYISDGMNHPPGFDWLWQPYLPDLGVEPFGPPPAGEVVAFMLNDVTRTGAADHGTLCASAAVAQGVINSNAPPWKPEASGAELQAAGNGMVQGGGRDARVFAMQYYDAPFPEDGYWMAALGYDGLPDTGDEAQIVSNSYGFSELDNDGWDITSRLLAYINLAAAPQLTWLFSTGNGAMGYGTITPPKPFTGISVGASTLYGSTTTFDSIVNIDQINHGDVMSWSGRGPAATGGLGPEITANGAWGAGDQPLNEVGDGWAAWTSWGGTSKASPTTAGNLALVYDAYKQAHGVFPTFMQARELLMGSATDSKHDPLVGGSGVVDAERATDLAAGLGGLYASPAFWQAGDYRGQQMPGFANIVPAGGTSSQTFVLHNQHGVEADAELSAVTWRQTGEARKQISTDVSLESPYSGLLGAGNRPDYLWDITGLVAGNGLYRDADLVVATLDYPYSQFSPSDPTRPPLTQDNQWRLAAYNWTDINGDGIWWNDADSNGVVNDGELDLGEWMRFTYGYNDGTSMGLTVHDPGSRYADGFYLGLLHRSKSPDRMPSCTLTITVHFYKRVAWPWLSLDRDSLSVPANGVANVLATLSVPQDAPLGMYEGAILIVDPGQAPRNEATTIVPVVVNVAATGADFQFGGIEQPYPYDNGSVGGFSDWSWRAEAGDWRFFFADVPAAPAASSESRNLLVHTTWEDYPTDIDTLVYGPGAPDVFSRNLPDVFGDYALADLGGSPNAYLGSGKFLFNTATGGTEDWVAGPASSGLHLVMLHNVLYAGDDAQVAFSGHAGIAFVSPAEIEIPWREPAGSTVVTFRSTVPVDSITAAAYGLSKTEDYVDPAVQDDPDDVATASIRHTFWITQGGMLKVNVDAAASDVDLYVLYDFDGDGEFDFDSELIASSAGPTGHEFVQVALPPDGFYLAAAHGWDVTEGDPVATTIEAAQGFDLAVSDIVRNPDGTFTFNVSWDKAIPNGESFSGIVWLGPSSAPATLFIPVTASAPELHSARIPVSADTYIDGWRPNVNPDTDLASPVYRPLRLRQGGVYEPLLQFDVSGIPSNATVESASMNLYCYGVGNYSMEAGVYKLLRAWEEAQATWLRGATADFWGAPGATDTSSDRVPQAFSVSSLTPASRNTFVAFDVKSLVQEWVSDPATNFGCLLQGMGPVSTEYSFRSSEDSHPSDHPFIEVAYTVE